MADNQLTVNQKVESFKGVLNSQQIRGMVKNSLKENAGPFMASMLDVYTENTDLWDCDPMTVAMQCIKAATLKLSLVKSLGQSYVVKYKGKPTFVIGYKGYIQLAHRTGLFNVINADALYEGEEIKFDRLSGNIKIYGERKSDKVIGYFAYFKLTTGFEKSFYMTLDEVQAWGKKYSPSYNSQYSPWKNFFGDMAKKTALRRIFKYAPINISDNVLSTAIANDEKAEEVSREIGENANQQVIDIPADNNESEQQQVEPADENNPDIPSEPEWG